MKLLTTAIIVLMLTGCGRIERDGVVVAEGQRYYD